MPAPFRGDGRYELAKAEAEAAGVDTGAAE